MKLRHLLPFLFLLSITACADESPQEAAPETVNQLLGRWNITEATRNGRPTDNLTDAYLEISPDGKLLYNLDGSPQNANWALNGKILSQTGGRLDIDYTIQELTNNNLVLGMTLRSIPFVMKFEKVTAEEVQESTVQ